MQKDHFRISAKRGQLYFGVDFSCLAVNKVLHSNSSLSIGKQSSLRLKIKGKFFLYILFPSITWCLVCICLCMYLILRSTFFSFLQISYLKLSKAICLWLFCSIEPVYLLFCFVLFLLISLLWGFHLLNKFQNTPMSFQFTTDALFQEPWFPKKTF